MKILLIILLLFSLGARGQQTIFKMWKYSKIEFSQVVAPPDTEDPTAPVASFVGKTATTISISWTSSTDNVAVVYYNVYKGGVFYASEIGNSIIVTGLTQNTSYSINVRAVDAAGNESANSNTITQTTNDAQNPTAPTVSLVSKTTTTISVSWSGATDNVGVTSYDLYKDGLLYDNTTSTSGTISGLVQDTEYDIYVRSRDAAGNVSSNSNTLTVTTDAEPDPPAAADEIFRMVSTGTCSSGWQYLDPDDDTWKCMSLATIVGSNGSHVGYGYAAGNTALQNMTFDGVAVGASKLIEGKIFLNMSNTQNGHGLYLQNCTNVTVRNCLFLGTSITNTDDTGNRGLVGQFDGPYTFKDNLFVNCRGGILIHTSTSGSNLVQNNEFINCPGPWKSGQFIAFVDCSGTNNIIENNRGENWLGESYAEDMMSFYGTDGTSGSPVLIQNNKFKGDGASPSGGGSVVGETGGTYCIMQDNDYIEPGHYAFGIYKGDHHIVRRNRVWQPAKPWTDDAFTAFTPPCTNMIIEDNEAFYQNSAGNSSLSYFPPGECSFITLEAITSVSSSAMLTAMQFPTKNYDHVVSDATTPLITFVDNDTRWRLRAPKTYMNHIITNAARDNLGSATNDDGIGWERRRVERPTADAEADNTVTGTFTTLTNSSTAAAGNTIAGYKWVFVSGPTTPTLGSPTSSSTTVSGMTINGNYVFRLEVRQNNFADQSLYNSFPAYTYHADWVTITKE